MRKVHTKNVKSLKLLKDLSRKEESEKHLIIWKAINVHVYSSQYRY